MRCNAMSKQTGNQCGAHAIRGKTKCKYHGGWSTGPKTKAGRKRCADVNTKHGRYTIEATAERKAVLGLIRQSDELLSELDV